MKFAIRFYQGCRVMAKADELIIKYDYRTANLIDFVTDKPENQRIIVNITNLKDIENCIEIFKLAKEAHPNFAILLDVTQIEVIDILKENKLPYFFINGASSLNDFEGIISLGVSDIYIVNELGFYLDKIGPICKEKNIQIRVYPNIVQSNSMFETDTLKNFFIRPDDVQFYEKYVDVFEFFGPLNKQAILYDIYRDERWQGELDDVILNLNQGLNCMSIVPTFGSARVGCMKRCTYGRCQICDHVKILAGDLKEKELYITKGKRKYEPKFDEDALQNESAESIDSTREISEEEI